MHVVYPRCCGLDVHQKTVVAGRLLLTADGELIQERRTFGTMTEELLSLSDWLAGAEVTHVAMESTGVYWKPIWRASSPSWTSRSLQRRRPFEETLPRLAEIPGVGRRTLEQVLAETGTDMSRFPTPRPLSSWTGICPGNNESAGKRKSGKCRKGNRWLRCALGEAAHAAGRKRGSYLASQDHRLAARRGKKKAAVAVGHSLLVIIYPMLKEGTPYRELGDAYFDERDRQAVIRRAVGRLERLGCKVTVEQPPVAA